MKLERVVRLSDDEYIIQSGDESFLKELKEKYEDSEIFNGLSEPILYHGEDDLTQYRIHKVVLSKAKIIEIDKLPMGVGLNLRFSDGPTI